MPVSSKHFLGNTDISIFLGWGFKRVTYSIVKYKNKIINACFCCVLVVFDSNLSIKIVSHIENLPVSRPACF